MKVDWKLKRKTILGFFAVVGLLALAAILMHFHAKAANTKPVPTINISPADLTGTPIRLELRGEQGKYLAERIGFGEIPDFGAITIASPGYSKKSWREHFLWVTSGEIWMSEDIREFSNQKSDLVQEIYIRKGFSKGWWDEPQLYMRLGKNGMERVY